MSNCLPCTDPIPPCQGCKKTQECTQIARTCQQCPRNICVDTSSSSKSSSGGTSTGTTAGATVGGVLGVAVVIGLVWWFWWRPKGLQLSRKRYSKHLLNRQSKLGLGNLEKRKSTTVAGRGEEDGGGGGGVATKRTSVHLRMENNGTSTDNNRRNTNGVATGNLVDETVPISRTSEDDNPFGDQNRSSIGTFGINDDTASTHTSEFSFRSSHSTNIIPIAYIPPHSSSLSVDDAQGRHHSARPQSRTLSPTTMSNNSMMNPHRRSSVRASIPTSMASRDSLALAGAEIIELNLLPPVLTPDTPSIPLGSTLTSNGAPIRPPRSPGLDLQLPKTSSPLTSPPINSPHRFSNNQFPFTTTPSAAGGGSGGSPTSPTYSHHQLKLPPPIPATKQNGTRSGSSQSHLSIMSSMTSRSNNSTMSYILDPPQIITPVTGGTGTAAGVGGGGVKRVEFQQAKAHKLGGGPAAKPLNGVGGGTSPTSPLATNDPFSDEAASIEERGGRETGNLSRPISSSSRWTSTSSLISVDSTTDEGGSGESVQFLQGQSITFTNPHVLPLSATTTTLTSNNNNATGGGGGGTLQQQQQQQQQRGMSTLSVDLPRSARSSQTYSINDDDDNQMRRSVWSSTSGSTEEEGGEEGRGPSSEGMNRTSTTETTTSHDSLLAGIPFMAPPTTTSQSSELASNSQLTNSSFLLSSDENETEDSLPKPFLPFAGQKPTTNNPNDPGAEGGGGENRVQSSQFSVRSGFGSGLSQIPFQLGFPSGFGDDDEDLEDRSERGSMLSNVSRDPLVVGAGGGGERWSGRGIEIEQEDAEEEEEDGLSRIDENTERGAASEGVNSRRESVKSNEKTEEGASSNLLPTPPASPPSTSRVSLVEQKEEEEKEENPFGSHAEVERDGSDPRASMDTLALNAALSANLDAQG